ncbi:HGxxPAAW family protein [Streptomyces sp. NPDC016309]|uniref:HGxxPAAW family protein n=1 Tax=Streptomyces sp. NPDC016309 TaxID=3364965 RepID=UPI0036F8559C
MSAHGDVDLGHTLAGWTGTLIGLAGLCVTGSAVVAVSLPLALTGLGVLGAAAVVTWVLHLAGWGKPSGPRPEGEWPWRVRDAAARHGHADCLGCRMAGRRPERAGIRVRTDGPEPATTPAPQGPVTPAPRTPVSPAAPIPASAPPAPAAASR